MTDISLYRSLFRLPIAVLVTCSAITAYIAASPIVTAEIAFTAAAVLLLACGASALNQYQEQDIDGMMERTRHRPLPLGLMHPRRALMASCASIAAGLLLLGRSGLPPFFLGIAAIAWYNGLYTPLKRRSPFAAVWGAPVGMTAPAIGWTAAGGSISDPRLAVLALLFFLWQVPHFWLLLLRSGGEYERAGLPVITKVFPRELLSGISVLWTASAAAASLLLPLFGMVRTPLLYGLLLLAALLSSVGAGWLARSTPLPRAAFPLLNAFIATVMLLISADALLIRWAAP
jgi:protoheme IX farnesyltransferase